MTPIEWAVVLGGAALVVFELWFFLGGLPEWKRRGGS